MGEMKRADAWEAEQRAKDRLTRERFASTIVIAAAIIAAVRLAREESLSKSSPRVAAAIGDSILLATAILNRVLRS